MSQSQLTQNLQQQTKRLLDQLKELEENREELGEEEYEQMKKSTLEELETFQNSLNSMLKNPNNSLLQSEIEKSKREIFQAFKSQFNKDEVVDKLLSEQTKGKRHKIVELEHQFHLKTIPQSDYISRKRKLIVQIEEIGAKLTNEQREWLQLNHFSEGSSEVKEEIQKSQLKFVQQKMEEK